MNTVMTKGIYRAIDVWFSNELLFVRLDDGREVGTPVDWFPRLKSASEEQRMNWRIIGSGIGIKWEEVPEDIAVSGLFSE